MKISGAFIILLLFTFTLHSQNPAYGIDTNYDPNSQECAVFNNALQSKPKEVKFGIKRKGNKLFLSCTDEKFLKNLLKGSKDGIAIDVVSKKRYACEETPGNTQIRGVLLKPAYGKQIFRKYDDQEKMFLSPVGVVPTDLVNDELEFNILFLKDNKMCRYYALYDLESYPWDLMDMGLYLDEIVYKNRTRNSTETIERFKTLKFTIPFEKNKIDYAPEDIRPLYDSLELTNYNIKKIDIKAYASVEGTTEGNIKLQKGRAESIVASLQSFQKENIETRIETAENWVEFLEDVQKTIYKSLATKSQSAIKSALTGKTSSDLEPILANHRKAIVTLKMNRIDLLKDKTIDELITDFKTNIGNESMEQAEKIYYTLIDKILEKNEPSQLKDLELPQQKKFADFNNSSKSLEFLFDNRQALIVKNALNKLEELDPSNKKIKYNKVVIDFMLWRSNAGGITEKDLVKDIKALSKYGIEKGFIERFLINLNIVKAEQHMRERKFNEKDKAVKFILDHYKNATLSDADYVSLAQYLTYFDSVDQAVKLLDPKAKALSADDDILFYYLNLTIIDNERTAQPAYRTIMQNAIDKDKTRFCKLFDPAKEGGVTFQLLEDQFLRDTYCETCVE
jgi:outer membrane protein OmpA-like peptidoglycan-associated protein